MALGVHSEVGRLRRVMVHRPGLEHTRLTPSNAEELLFDDVLWVARAKQEHDSFSEVMRERGVEVYEVERLLAEALSEPGVREWACDHILSEREVGIGAADRAREWVGTAEASLVGQRPSEEAFHAAAAAAAAQSEPVSDVRGPAEYKRAMVAELTLRSLRRATERALAFNG